MMKRVLVGLGSLEYARSATSMAIELAQKHDLTLTGVTLYDVDRLDSTGPVPIGGGQLARELAESRLTSAQEIIRAAESHFTTECKQAGVEHRLLHETGNPLTTMISLTRYHDLVVCGQQSLFEHGVVDDPPDELAQLVQAGVRPLLAVTEHRRPIKRVLIAYSGSMESAKTMKLFLRSGLWPEAELRIVTFADDAAIGDERLAAAADYCRAHGFAPEVECVVDSPKNSLLPYAAQCQADLIVMGNSSKNMLLRKILGETALYAMRNAKVPLFLAQ
jgi:nucleotide-binding universal stress UspA family protein